MISTITSGAESVGEQITSVGGSVYTVATNGAGDIVSTITSGAESIGNQVTSAGGSVYTVATNSAGSVVSTIESAASSAANDATGTSDSGAKITPAPVIAGGLLGAAGMAVVALL